MMSLDKPILKRGKVFVLVPFDFGEFLVVFLAVIKVPILTRGPMSNLVH